MMGYGKTFWSRDNKFLKVAQMFYVLAVNPQNMTLHSCARYYHLTLIYVIPADEAVLSIISHVKTCVCCRFQ